MLRFVFRGLWKKRTVVLLSFCLLTTAVFLALLASAMTSVSTATAPGKHLTVATVSDTDGTANMKTVLSRIRERSVLVKDIDARVTAKGYSPSFTSYIPSSDPGMVMHADYCILVVKLRQVTVTENPMKNLRYHHEYQMEIEQIVAMHEVYRELDVGSVIRMENSYREENDGWSEEGGTYLISGTLYPREVDGKQTYYLKYPTSAVQEYRRVIEHGGMHCLYATLTGEKTPFVSTLNMPLDDFLKTEIGMLWQQVILPIPQVSYRSMDVIGTGLLDSIVAFNMEETTVIEGEVFTQEQYDSGAPVCLVSEEWVRYHGCSVGDSLPLSLYWPQNQYQLPSSSFYSPRDGFFNEVNYRIIGIYRNAAAYDGSCGVHPNTVFVPLRSLGEIPHQSAHISFVLDEGKENAFEMEMKQLDYGNWMRYYSGPQTEDPLVTLAAEEARARFVADASACAESVRRWSVGLIAVAVLLLVLFGKREIGLFYRIETAEGVLLWHFLLQMLLLGGISAGIAAMAAKQLLPTLVPQLLYRLADPAFADRLTEELAACPPMGRTLCITLAWVLGCGILCGVFGMKRKYHYEYLDGGEK